MSDRGTDIVSMTPPSSCLTLSLVPRGSGTRQPTLRPASRPCMAADVHRDQYYNLRVRSHNKTDRKPPISINKTISDADSV